jgi:OmpA family protein
MKYLTITAIIASSLTMTSALAYGRYPAPYQAPYQQGYRGGYGMPKNEFYIAGDVGSGTLATPDQNLADPDGVYITGASHSNSDVAAGGTIGFRHFVNPMLAVGAEFGYDYNGQAKYEEDYGTSYYYNSLDNSTLKITSQDFHMLATGTVLFRSGFNLFGKAGAARVDQSAKTYNEVPAQDIPYLTTVTSVASVKPMAAAGFGFRFKKVEIYAQYSHIFGTDATADFSDLFDSNGNMNVVSVDTFKVGLAMNLRV